MPGNGFAVGKKLRCHVNIFFPIPNISFVDFFFENI